MHSFMHCYGVRHQDGYGVELAVVQKNMSVPSFFGTNPMGPPTLIGLVHSYPSPASCGFRGFHIRVFGPARYCANWLGNSLYSLIQFGDLLLLFYSSDRPTCVGKWRAYIKFWHDTHCSRLKVLFQFANCFLMCSLSVIAFTPDVKLAVGLS